VSDPRLDQLAESARNRRLRLVRSRVRTPGKRRFGKVGLTDSAGKPVLGMDSKGPTGSADEIEAYLRKLDARDWGASLDVAVPARKRRTRKPPRQAANDTPPRKQQPKPQPSPAPAPILKIRHAKPADAAELAKLIKLLGHEVDAKGVRNRIAELVRQKLPQLVATLDNKIVGLAGVHAMIAIHREQPVGRITILVVAEQARGRGIGRRLVDAAEQLLKNRGCGMVEVTSNDRLAEAHAFYRHLGYERTSIRFVKKF
jgi:GNAT superfamily N-acetyltransferase